jgi:hypothetical protein
LPRTGGIRGKAFYIKKTWTECYNKVKLGKDKVILNLKMRKRRQINAESVRNSGITIKKRKKIKNSSLQRQTSGV